MCKEALGPDSKIMVDRTGDDAPIGNTGRSDWTHEEAMEIAHALKEAGADWLEEPFKRDYTVDGASEETVARHARLTAEAPLPITGGEHQPVAVYHDYLAGNSFDIVQPHLQNLLSDLRKIGGACELFGVDCIFHGHHGMDLIGSLQVGATIPSARMQEIVFTTPGILPEEVRAAAAFAGAAG